MRSRRTIVIILCAALLPFALGAWYLLGNDEEAADTSAPKIAQSGDTICDQFLATMPDDLSDRKKAGKVCVDALPKLRPEDQLRIANEYAIHARDYIDKDDLDELIPKLYPDAALSLRAHALIAPSPYISGPYKLTLNEVLAEAEQSNNPVALVSTLYATQLVHFFDDDINSFDDETMARAINIAEREGLDGLTPKLRHLWAYAYELRGDYVKSIKQSQEAIRQFEANEDYTKIALSKVNLSYIYAKFQDSDTAIQLAQEAVKAFEDHAPDNVRSRGAGLSALAEHLSLAGRHDEAVAAFDNLASFYEQEDEVLYPSYQVGHIRALHESGQSDAAMQLAVEKLEAGDIPAHSHPIRDLLAWLGARHAERGEYEQTKRYFAMVFENLPDGEDSLIGALDNPGIETPTLVVQHDLLLAAIVDGNAAQAIDIAVDMEKRTKDHVAKSKVNAVAGHELQTKVDTLTLETERKELQLNASRSQLALAAFSAVALGIIAFVAYRSFQTQKRLTATQERLAEQKSTYLDEIHHRTKNNFQVLSSILNLDIRRLDATEQGEGRRLDAVNRLQTMALVHDHIYSLDAAKDSAADLSDFIDDLLALMDESLGREDVALEWDVIGGKINVTRLTPFGLLLCELITNSYKHAFADKGGTIAIHISEVGGMLAMTLKDNGKGFDTEAARNKPGRLGMGLIFDLADQIGGDLTVVSGENGTVWTLQ